MSPSTPLVLYAPEWEKRFRARGAAPDSYLLDYAKGETRGISMPAGFKDDYLTEARATGEGRRVRTMIKTIAALVLFLAGMWPLYSSARIEIFLMGQTAGLKPPPFDPGIWFRGTPFGHMALYVESATRDGEKVIRQCREGERGGLVLTVDKALKDGFFTANTRDEFFYGPLDSANLPASLSREEIGKALEGFNVKYGRLYREGPGISGLGQDYGALYIRHIRGFVYPTTRGEEAKIIEFWQEHRRDAFVPMTVNCVTTIIGAMNRAGLERRSFFIRGLSPYNAWAYYIKRLLWAGPGAKAPNGNYLRRDGSYLTDYPQIPSDAVRRSGRPFNVYSLHNLEYTVWAGPPASPVPWARDPSDRRACPPGFPPLPSGAPISFRDYPTGRERAEGKGPGGAGPRDDAVSYFWWTVSQPEEFFRLWFQSFNGLWYLVAG